MKILLFLFMLFGPLQLWAEDGFVITSFSGASGQEFNTTTGTKTAYGGMVTTLSCTGSSTCNTCNDVGPGFKPCNQNQINDDTVFTLNWTWNGDSKPGSVLRIGVTSTYSGIIVAPGTTVGLTKGMTGSYSIQWKYLCDLVNSNSAHCDGLTTQGVQSKTVSFGIDNDNDGVVDSGYASLTVNLEIVTGGVDSYSSCTSTDAVCSFKVFPGDEKIYFDNVEYPGGTLGTSPAGGTYSGLQIFFKVVNGGQAATLQSLANVTPSVGISLDSETDTDFKLTDLDNDTEYCVILAGVTKNGNILSAYPNNSVAITTTQDYCARPQKVFGLLDGKKCFIATAAFGSDLDPHVDLFRNFRDQILLKTKWGTQFVSFYYSYSPKYAKWLETQPTLKMMVRSVLWVMLIFVQVALQFGMLASVMLMISLAGAITFGFIFYHQKKKRVLARSKID